MRDIPGKLAMGLIASIVRWAGITAACIMLLSFILYATDRSSEATKDQVDQVDGRAVPVKRDANEPNKYRQKLDEVNDKLATPFDPLTRQIGSEWARHGLTALLGLLVFGVGVAWLANLLPKSKMREPTPWHT